jgi:hypothetical protein
MSTRRLPLRKLVTILLFFITVIYLTVEIFVLRTLQHDEEDISAPIVLPPPPPPFKPIENPIIPPLIHSPVNWTAAEILACTWLQNTSSSAAYTRCTFDWFSRFFHYFKTTKKRISFFFPCCDLSTLCSPSTKPLSRTSADYNCTPVHPNRPRFSYIRPDLSDVHPVVTVAIPFYNTKPEIFNQTMQYVFLHAKQNVLLFSLV